MKRLTLVRHAKSSWKNATTMDIDRRLSSRGKRDAPHIGAYLAEKGIVPDIIFTSPAYRARKTASYLAAAIPVSKEQIYCNLALYDAAATTLLALVHTLEENWRHVLVVAHNPGLTDFANQLTASSIDNIPTCGVMVVDFAVDSWNEVRAGAGHMFLYVTPKSLPQLL